MRTRSTVRSAIAIAAFAALTVTRSAWAQQIDTVNWANDTVADGTGTGTLSNGTITVNYTTQADGGVTLPIDFNNSLATNDAVGTGVTHLIAVAITANNLTAATQTVRFSSAVINPIVYIVFADPNTSLTFTAPLTLLDSNNAQLSGGNLVTFAGSTNTSNDGFAARVNGAFGPANPLSFIYSNQSGAAQSFSLTVGLTPVPEPGSVALLVGIAVTGAGFARKRRRR